MAQLHRCLLDQKYRGGNEQLALAVRHQAVGL